VFTEQKSAFVTFTLSRMSNGRISGGARQIFLLGDMPMKSTVRVRKIHQASPGSIFLALAFFAALSLTAFAPATRAQQHIAKLKVVEMFVSHGQRFSCSIDFPQAECLRELSLIRDLLLAYHAEDLGPWHWILVFADVWKPLLQSLGVHSSSPAITSYIDRETLVEGSLFAPTRARAFELLHEFHLPLEDLLTRTLTHELGHAYCGDPDEIKAEQAAQQIRRGVYPACSSLVAGGSRKMGGGNPGK
jgi:hypothetical protein